jgi:hypothetical protein
MDLRTLKFDLRKLLFFAISIWGWMRNIFMAILARHEEGMKIV